jgi:DNA-binding transcriptional ArsR family regulator
MHYYLRMQQDIAAFEMPSDETVEHAAEQMRILSDATRLKLLWAIAQGETSVASLAEIVGVTPTGASQHLAKLRMTGLVRARRDGTFVYYTLEDMTILQVLDVVMGRSETARPPAPRRRRPAGHRR